MKRPKVIDLSFPIHEGMTTFPSHWHPFVEVTQLGRHGIEDRESRKVTLGTHTGTHVDAPVHFVEGAATIDAMPLSLMVGRAGLIDLGPAKPKHEYSLEELRAALKDRKVLPRMLVRFGWSGRWGKLDYYTKAPHLSLEACRWLVARGVRLLGVDTPNVDDHLHGWKSGNDCPNHRALLGRGVFLVEYLNNLNRLRGPELEFIVCPLNILGADGSSARCLAIEA